MRIDAKSHSIETVASSKLTNADANIKNQSNITEHSYQEVDQAFDKEKMHQVIDSINEIFNINNNNLKFVYHDGLKEYFVQLVNTDTDEVVKEIPPKKLLDAYYEMQKLVGMIIDEKR